MSDDATREPVRPAPAAEPGASPRCVACGTEYSGNRAAAWCPNRACSRYGLLFDLDDPSKPHRNPRGPLCVCGHDAMAHSDHGTETVDCSRCDCARFVEAKPPGAALPLSAETLRAWREEAEIDLDDVRGVRRQAKRVLALLAEVERLTGERDEWKRNAEQAASNFDMMTRTWEAERQRAEAAERERDEWKQIAEQRRQQINLITDDRRAILDMNEAEGNRWHTEMVALRQRLAAAEGALRDVFRDIGPNGYLPHMGKPRSDAARAALGGAKPEQPSTKET